MILCDGGGSPSSRTSRGRGQGVGRVIVLDQLGRDSHADQSVQYFVQGNSVERPDFLDVIRIIFKITTVPKMGATAYQFGNTVLE